LPVGRGVTDVFRERAADVRVLLAKRRDDCLGVAEAESGLREVSDAMVRGDVQLFDLADVFDDVRAVGRFAEGADDFVVIAVTDQDDRKLLPRVADRLRVDFCDQGTGRVDLNQLSPRRLATNFRRHAVRAEYDRGAMRHFIDRVDELHAAIDEPADYVAVMHDLMEYVNRRALHAQHLVDAIDCHIDAGTEPARLAQQNSHRRHDIPSQQIGRLDFPLSLPRNRL